MKNSFMEKSYRKCAPKKLVPDTFLILKNNPKQPLHARNYFKNKYFKRGLSKTFKVARVVDFKIVFFFGLIFL